MRWLPLPLVAAAMVACEEPQGGGSVPAPTVEEVPSNVLARWVRWSTAEPARTRVEFGCDGALESYVGAIDGSYETDHTWLVLGLAAGADIQLQAVSVAEDGTERRSAPVTFTTDVLPFEPPAVEITALDEGRKQPGWTLFNLVQGEALSPVVALMVDADGEVVWYHELGADDGGADVEVTLVDGDRVLIGGSIPPGERPVEVTLAGDVVWEGPEQPDGLYTAGGMHHALTALPDGGHLGLFYDFRDSTLVDVVRQLDEDGEATWSWHPYDALGEDGLQYLHGNMVGADPDRGVVWYNARHISTLYQIDRDDGAVLWALGEGRDFAFVGDHDHPWFLQAHAPEVGADGRVLLYDNGSPGLREFSRVVEYALDEDTMTATLVWEYPGELADDPWFTFAWGDADRLDNGNTLITAAGLTSWDSPGRIFEVTPDGAVVWEAQLDGPAHKDRIGTYAAERIPALTTPL